MEVKIDYIGEEGSGVNKYKVKLSPSTEFGNLPAAISFAVVELKLTHNVAAPDEIDDENDETLSEEEESEIEEENIKEDEHLCKEDTGANSKRLSMVAEVNKLLFFILYYI